MRIRIKDIAFLFIKLGFIGFGGPAAHIAMMRDEVVVRRSWMSDAEFLDLVGITNLIPGPNSTEMAIHLGKIKGGFKGLLIAGLCFIIPAVAITLGIAILYNEYGTLPAVQPFIYGIKPAIIAVIISAVLPLARTAIKSWTHAIIGVISFALSFLGYPQLWIMIGAGIAYLLIAKVKFNQGNSRQYMMLPLMMVSQSIGSISSSKLFFIFLKIGAILYGSGYVLFSFIDTELVAPGFLSREVLADAIAVGQMTPGPVFSSVTFIGYHLAGWEGALFSTIGVFLPSFIFIAILGRVFIKLKTSAVFMSFLSGVNVASIALIASVAILLGTDAINDWRTIVIGIISMLVAFLFKHVNSAFIVIGGSMLGYLLTLV